MIDRLEKTLKKWRRHLSRSAWLARRLGLPSYEGSPVRPGLVMIQIDGLSQPEFRKALYRGEMPFLKSLIDKEHYQEHSHYSGLPSCTPAVQAEIFYGIKTAVPAFAFRDEKEGRIVRMYEPPIAAGVEKKLMEQQPEHLLKGGSAYCDNFAGGAQEAHFCASTMGASAALEAANPFSMFLLIITNLLSVLRMFGLVFIELWVATWDFIRGVTNGRSFGKELKFIPTRVGICILLREFLVVGAKIDIERGLPIIHLNFIGFDEQAHRRGPSSDFAHWCLKGIDSSIRRIWQAAHKAPWRQYDVWIYSDHGQCVTKSFYKAKGYEIEEALNQAFAKLQQDVPPVQRLFKVSTDVQRCCLLGSHDVAGGHAIHKCEIPEGSDGEAKLQPEVANLGPVGLVYPGATYSPAALRIVAQSLACDHNVPVAITRDEKGHFIASTADGDLMLPEQTSELFGAEHPFLEDMKEDLLRLCKHPNAGDIVLLGWRKGVESMTFCTENGSHAGLTPEETNPFSLLPRHTQLPNNGKSYLRPAELRAAALHFLGRETYKDQPRYEPFTAVDKTTLKVMTYNVHSCIGLDGKLDVARIARVIAQEQPDIVALQELDVGRVRSGKDDQAQLIADLLEMNYEFHPAIHLEEEKYGDAILTHLPLRTIRAGVLPGEKPNSKREPRGAIWVTVNFNGVDVHVLNTHLGLSRSERVLQAHTIMGEWLQDALKAGEPVIVCGDLNARPGSKPYEVFASRLQDVQLQVKKKPRNTFYSRFPSFRIDHIFVNDKLEVTSAQVPRHRTAVTASDHLPLIAELTLKRGVEEHEAELIAAGGNEGALKLD